MKQLGMATLLRLFSRFELSPVVPRACLRQLEGPAVQLACVTEAVLVLSNKRRW